MINKNSLFKDIKSWFAANYNDLPQTLETPFKNYGDVRAFVVFNIKQIEGIEKPKESKVAKSSKRNLVELYIELNERKNEKKHSK